MSRFSVLLLTVSVCTLMASGCIDHTGKDELLHEIDSEPAATAEQGTLLEDSFMAATGNPVSWEIPLNNSIAALQVHVTLEAAIVESLIVDFAGSCAPAKLVGGGVGASLLLEATVTTTCYNIAAGKHILTLDIEGVGSGTLRVTS